MLLNITSSTVAQVLVLAKVDSELYTCRAVGDPLPLELEWRAQGGGTDVTRLTNNIDGLQISTSEGESGEIVSALRLRLGGDFLSPYCSVTNNGSNALLANRRFTRVEPITGMFDSR